MSTEITMPKLSDTMTEGRLVAWKKSVGDRVERGDIIAEVETDKANMELESFSSGTLLEIRVRAGEMVPVETVIGVLGEAGEKVEKDSPLAEAPPVEEPPAAEARPESVVKEVSPESTAEPVNVEPPPAARPEAAEKASPLVRRLAREQGVDLEKVGGSGPEGRILQEDLERFLKERQAPMMVSTEEEPVYAVTAEAVAVEVEPLSRMRAAIARTVTTSWRTIPHFSVTVAVNMDEAVGLRRVLKGEKSPVSLNDIVIRATALALRKFPLLNASLTEGGISRHREINIGFAVNVDEGLLVPVIRGCGELSLRELAVCSRELADKARTGQIREEEINGGTFTVSNLGSFGVEEFVAVIHPPQVAILAVGAITDQPVVINGEVEVAKVMRLTISADHRIIDGAYAARFLSEVRRSLENPVLLVV